MICLKSRFILHILLFFYFAQAFSMEESRSDSEIELLLPDHEYLKDEIDHLPNEIWIKIIEMLDIKSICLLSEMSKKFSSLSNRPKLIAIIEHINKSSRRKFILNALEELEMLENIFERIDQENNLMVLSMPKEKTEQMLKKFLHFRFSLTGKYHDFNKRINKIARISDINTESLKEETIRSLSFSLRRDPLAYGLVCSIFLGSGVLLSYNLINQQLNKLSNDYYTNSINYAYDYQWQNFIERCPPDLCLKICSNIGQIFYIKAGRSLPDHGWFLSRVTYFSEIQKNLSYYTSLFFPHVDNCRIPQIFPAVWEISHLAQRGGIITSAQSQMINYTNEDRFDGYVNYNMTYYNFDSDYLAKSDPCIFLLYSVIGVFGAIFCGFLVYIPFF